MASKKEEYQNELKMFVDAYIQNFLNDIGLRGVTIPTRYQLHSSHEAVVSSKYNPQKGITIAYQRRQHPAKNLFSGIHEATHAIQHFLIKFGLNKENIYSIDSEKFQEIVCDFFKAKQEDVSIDRTKFANFLSNNDIDAQYIRLLDFDIKHYPVYGDFQTYSLSVSEVMANDIALKYAYSVITAPDHVIGKYRNATVLDKDGYSYFGVLSSFHEKQRLIYEKSAGLTNEQRIKNQIACSIHPILWRGKIKDFLNLPWEKYTNIVINAERNLRDLKDKYYHSEIISEEYRDFLIKEDEKTRQKEKTFVRDCMQQMKLPEMNKCPDTAMTYKISDEHGIIPSVARLQENNIVIGVNIEERQIYFVPQEASKENDKTGILAGEKDFSNEDCRDELDLDER